MRGINSCASSDLRLLTGSAGTHRPAVKTRARSIVLTFRLCVGQVKPGIVLQQRCLLGIRSDVEWHCRACDPIGCRLAAHYLTLLAFPV